MSELKNRILIEYPINCPANILYRMISTSQGLKGWFADRVDVTENEFTFFWGKVPHTALLLEQKENRYVRFSWIEDIDTEYFFEMTVISTELSGDTSLMIIDFAEESEIEDIKSIWNNNIKKLKGAIGSI